MTPLTSVDQFVTLAMERGEGDPRLVLLALTAGAEYLAKCDTSLTMDQWFTELITRYDLVFEVDDDRDGPD